MYLAAAKQLNRQRRDSARCAAVSLGALPGGTSAGDRVLVVVQLSGGNDGLNTVVPFGDDKYYKLRPTIAVPSKALHPIDTYLGWHPRMEACGRLYQEGFLTVVQGVGYPRPDGDHAVSMRHWQTAQPQQAACQTGWLGRAVDCVSAPDETVAPAVFVGNIRQPLTFRAQRAVVPSVRSAQGLVLHRLAGAEEGDQPAQTAADLARLSRAEHDSPILSFVQRSMLAACDKSERVRRAIDGGATDAPDRYPSYQLAQTLRLVAQLIRADAGIRVFGVELGGDGFGGFDSHANQLGNHDALLHQLSQSVGAFADDLRRDELWDRVLLMTFSEFGRTIAENGRRGTDHGSAAPMLLMGGRVRGGLVGPHPSLSEPESGGLKFHTDFRRVYATLLDQWLTVDSQSILGERFEPLPVLHS